MNEFVEIINIVSSRIPSDLKTKLTLVGSVNALLQGVPVIPKKDIDIATDYETVKYLSTVFAEEKIKYCKEPAGDASLPFSYLFILINSWEVEFFDTVNYGGSFYKDEISSDNTVVLPRIELKGLDLQTELMIYKKSGKTEKVKLIEDYLKVQ